jgi:hypothetical protein
VFEHFYQPKQEIEKLLALLKPNGRLILMMHLYNDKIDFRNWYYRNDLTHVFIYTAKTINYVEKSFNIIIKKQDERILIIRKRK